MGQLNFAVVFFEGILSFLSPCILPLLPVYIAILSNNADSKRSTLLKNTILFVLGISTTFFILGTGIGVLRPFLTEYKRTLLIGGGVLILVMGLFYTGSINIPFLQRERKLHYQAKQMGPWATYLLGFTFSFGWTPCIGPMLASVLVVASTSESQLVGNLLIGTYTLGFIIPFIILALFSEKMMKMLDKVKFKRDLLQKIGGYIIIITGIVVMVSGIRELRIIKPSTQTTPISENDQQESEKQSQVAPDFTLTDQYGNTHNLSSYKGKVVFLNFWATWCPPCRGEMPDIQKIYEKYGVNEEDVIILGVAAPNLGSEGSKEEIIEFLEEEKYTFPVVFDESAEVFQQYYINSFPTTFIINTEGNIEGYVPGAINQEFMEEIIARGYSDK